MRRSRRLTCALLITAAVALSLGATSCGGGSSGGGNSDLVLLGFNVPNIAGIPLNQPLIFTFSNDIDAASITPDTLRVVGALGPNFETTVVDGNLVALLPRSPNFEDYSDAGLLPGIQYTVSFAQYPAPSTIRTPDGKPLLDADSYQFTTVPAPEFVEPRRPIRHGLPPSAGGSSDDEGCLNNADNSVDTTTQFGSGLGARLLCLKNEGAPQVILDESDPTHNDRSVGSPSAVTPGFVNLPALRVRLNEPLDPITVAPYVPTDKLGLNVQLWLVGDTDRVPLPVRQLRTNKPLLVQSLTLTEIILVAANEDSEGQPVGGVPQGTYLINVTGAVSDLPGNGLDTADRPNPAIGGFQDVEDAVNASGDVPPGYRYYFVTLIVPGSPQSIVENYANNLNEWGDSDSGADEPGVYTKTNLMDELDPGDDILMWPIDDVSPPDFFLARTLTSTRDNCGQTTTANWNNGFRFFGISSLSVNADIDDGAGSLKAVYQPYAGSGQDGEFQTDDDGTVTGLNTSPGASVNGDGIYEFESFFLGASDTLNVSGSQPLVIFCRGDFTVEGTINLMGSEGGPGLDTDGSDAYANPNSIPAGGDGGEAGAGGGAGGNGGNPITGANGGAGIEGGAFTTVFGTGDTPGGGGGFADPTGGGGGGLSSPGNDGTLGDGTSAFNGGVQAGDAFLARPTTDFEPNRTYSPNSGGSGGTGGGGGGIADEGSGTVENGDAGGGGAGGAGGGLYVIAKGMVSISGKIHLTGGDGGNTYSIADQDIDLGADEAAGGTGEDADTVLGIKPTANPSGLGGPGGGGSGGAIFLIGRGGVTITSTADIDAQGGSGGRSGNADLVGGDGSPGIFVIGSIDGATVDVDGSSKLEPAPSTIDYQPTVDYVSVGQSEWFDVFTPTGVFEVFRWTDNFDVLQAAGLVQGTDFDALLEIQGADTVSPLPQDGPPTTATNLAHWVQINANDVAQDRVEYSGGGSPIDGKRFFRFRWRFRVNDEWPITEEPLPQILSTTIEFER